MANEMVTYTTEHGEVTLSYNIIKRYICTNPNVTDGEIAMFMELNQRRKLNPLLKESYLIKFGTSPAQQIVSKDVFANRAHRHPKFRGEESGVIVKTEKGDITERKGALLFPKETLLGGWMKVYIDGYVVPQYSAVTFAEYDKGQANWKTMPAGMIEKVAMVKGWRTAFEEEFAGMYIAEEMGITSELSTKAIDITNMQNETVIEPTQETEPIADEDVAEPSWVDKMKTATPVPHVVEQTAVRPNADYIMVKAGVNHKLAGLTLAEIPKETLFAIANKPVDPNDKWARKQMDTNEKINAFLHWKPTEKTADEAMREIPLPFDLD